MIPVFFRACLQTMVERHESYRTVYRLVDGEPMQMVRSPAKYDFPIIDLTHLDADAQEEEVNKRLRVEAQTPFDLENDLLLRASILVLGKEDHVLFLNQHHIATDGWSTQLLWKELSALYDAYKKGMPSPLSELKATYVGYAKAQKERLQGKYWNRLLNYWKQDLDCVKPLELPTDRPRPAKLSNAGGMETMSLDAALIMRLREFSHARGSTMHMTLLSAFQILLSRLSGQTDVVVGIPSVSRNDPDVERVIGVFLSTLLIRGNLSDNPTFSDFLNQIRMKSLEALDHGDMPL